jgi:hypothetical protein
MMLTFIGEYIMNVLRWLDTGINVLILLGSYNETVSERAARAREKGKTWGCVLCRILDWIVRDHCKSSLTIRIGDDAILKD